MGQISGGYIFPFSWQSNITRVHKAALSLYNFEIGGGSILSFRVELVNATAAGGAIVMEPVGRDAGIVQLKFSVVVIAEDSSHL